MSMEAIIATQETEIIIEKSLDAEVVSNGLFVALFEEFASLFIGKDLDIMRTPINHILLECWKCLRMR